MTRRRRAEITRLGCDVGSRYNRVNYPPAVAG
jgi:hypothetical protein